MYVVNGSDGQCIVAVRLIVCVRYLERPLREVLLYIYINIAKIRIIQQTREARFRSPIIYITSKRYSVGARLSGRKTDGLYVLLCRYIRSQATHKYVSRSAAS